MSTEDNKKAARRITEEPWNEGKLNTLDELCAPSFNMEGSGEIGELKQAIAEYRRGFPDIHMAIDDMIAEGDKVAFCWTCTGTHTGEYEGIAPTGKALKGTGISFYRFADGKLVADRFETSIDDLRQYLLVS
jgi:predicted ester cyclase